MAGFQDHGDNATGHYRHHHCNFPVSRAEPPKDQRSFRYLRIPIVLDDDGSQEKGQRIRGTAIQEQILLSAWAVLLQKYTGSDVVSFAAFHSAVCSDERRPVAGEEDCPGAEERSERCNPFILRYRVLKDARLQDVCEVSRELLTAADWARGASVNTAVNFSDRLDMVSCGQQDEEDEKGKLPNVELKAGHRNVNDYVRTLAFGSFIILLPSCTLSRMEQPSSKMSCRALLSGWTCCSMRDRVEVPCHTRPKYHPLTLLVSPSLT